MATTTSNQTNQDKQALRSAEEVSEMAGKIINRFGKAVQGILASAVIAGGLLLATPAVGSAHESEAHAFPVADCSDDWTGDRKIRGSDVSVVQSHFGMQVNGQDIRGDDISSVLANFGLSCPTVS